MNIQAWWIAFRPKTLIVSIAPVALGLALAYHNNNFTSVLIGILTLCAAVLIQIGTNLINDVYDFLSGADTDNRLGPARAVQSGLLSERKVKLGAYVCFLMALLIGIYLVYEGGIPILLIGSFALISGYCYTAGPYPLGYNGFGDLFVFIFFGLIATPGTYYLQTNILFDINAILIGSAIGFLAVAILCVNNIRDINSYKKAGKKTLAVRFGFQPVIILYDLMIVLSYVSIGMLFFNENFVWSLSLFLLALTIPMALNLLIDIHRKKGQELNGVLNKTIIFMRLFSFILIIGIMS